MELTGENFALQRSLTKKKKNGGNLRTLSRLMRIAPAAFGPLFAYDVDNAVSSGCIVNYQPFRRLGVAANN